MNRAFRMNIPVGHVAHFKTDERGEVVVEFLRFLKPHEAKLRRSKVSA